MTSSFASLEAQRTVEDVGDLFAAHAFDDERLDQAPHEALGAPCFHLGHFVRGLVADERALASSGQDDTLVLEQLVGAGDRVAIEPQVTGELANRGQCGIGLELPRLHRVMNLPNDLPVDRFGRVDVNSDVHLVGLIVGPCFLL